MQVATTGSERIQYLAELRRAFEHGDGASGSGDGNGGRETAESCAAKTDMEIALWCCL